MSAYVEIHPVKRKFGFFFMERYESKHRSMRVFRLSSCSRATPHTSGNKLINCKSLLLGFASRIKKKNDNVVLEWFPYRIYCLN